MRAIMISLSILLMAGMAEAKPSQKYTDWAEGPVRHLMTEADVQAWKAVTTDAEAEAFIELFWARRDPTPMTPENEWKAEFEVRVAAADEHFSMRRQKGSMTDRGRVVILLGSPMSVASRGPGRRAAAMSTTAPDEVPGGDFGVASARPTPARVTWTYSGDNRPAFIDRGDFDIIFQDESGRGDWQLATTEKLNPETILGEAVKYYIFNPDMTEVPDYAAIAALPSTSFQDASVKAAWEEFKAGEASDLGPGLLTWGEFVTPEGGSFAAVQLFMPAGSGMDAGKPVTLVGVVENEMGEIVALHEQPATLTKTVRDVFVDDSFRLEPGTYKASFGIADGGRLVAMKRTDLTINGLDPKEPGISDLILSNHIYPLSEAQHVDDPFAFGGLKVVPKTDGMFAKSDELWYFFELRNPGLTDQGAPRMMVRVSIEGTVAGEKPVRIEGPPTEVEAFELKGIEGRYGLGMSFPLEGFQPGKYTIKLRVTDTVLRKIHDFEKPFEIR